MHIRTRNVNTAFRTLVEGMHLGERNKRLSLSERVIEAIPVVSKPSRAGDVLMVEEPVILTYEKPLERVLFNRARDANPFFTMYESLWMLAGRNDVAPLAYYNSNIAEIASDDGKTFNGAYGYRWRYAKVADVYNNDAEPLQDQLKIIIDQLKRKPESRRVVLQMWNCEDDLLKIDQTKDVCCNVCAFFSTREIPWDGSVNPGDTIKVGETDIRKRVLDMTVCNRSNDLIWGMLGANAVHFSFLQEYLAAAIGVGVGVYNQITNNMHVYKSRWNPGAWLDEYRHKLLCGPCRGVNTLREYTQTAKCESCGAVLQDCKPDDSKKSDEFYPNPEWKFVPLIGSTENVAEFDTGVERFVGANYEAEGYGWSVPGAVKWGNEFLDLVAQPMCHAFHGHKARDYIAAIEWCNRIVATDWRIACTDWIRVREKKYNERRLGTDAQNVSTARD